MQLEFLGTGAGSPSKQRNVASVALRLLEERNAIWLFDVGEATQHQILNTTSLLLTCMVIISLVYLVY